MKRADGAARHVAMFKPSDSVSIQDDAVRAVIAATLRALAEEGQSVGPQRLEFWADSIERGE